MIGPKQAAAIRIGHRGTVGGSLVGSTDCLTSGSPKAERPLDVGLNTTDDPPARAREAVNGVSLGLLLGTLLALAWYGL